MIVPVLTIPFVTTEFDWHQIPRPVTVIVPALEIWPLMVLLSTLMPIPAAVLPGLIVPGVGVGDVARNRCADDFDAIDCGSALVTGPLGVVTLIAQGALAGVWAAANSAATEVVASNKPDARVPLAHVSPVANSVLVP